MSEHLDLNKLNEQFGNIFFMHRQIYHRPDNPAVSLQDKAMILFNVILKEPLLIPSLIPYFLSLKHSTGLGQEEKLKSIFEKLKLKVKDGELEFSRRELFEGRFFLLKESGSADSMDVSSSSEPIDVLSNSNLSSIPNSKIHRVPLLHFCNNIGCEISIKRFTNDLDLYCLDFFDVESHYTIEDVPVGAGFVFQCFVEMINRGLVLFDVAEQKEVTDYSKHEPIDSKKREFHERKLSKDVKALNIHFDLSGL